MKQANMLRCFLIYHFLSLPSSAAICHYPSHQSQLQSTDILPNEQGDDGRLFVLTCSSSLHTATSRDYCSPAAFQCVCLRVVW